MKNRVFLISFHVLKAPAGGVTQGLPGMRTLRTHTTFGSVHVD